MPTPEELEAEKKAAEEKAAAEKAAKGGADGRTEKALLEEQARQGARLSRIEAHLGIDEMLSGDDDDDKEESDDADEEGVDDILAGGVGLFDGGDESEDEDERPEKKLGKKAA